MSWRNYILLSILGIVVLLIAASFQTVPGYMDDDYYYLGGLQLVRGEGFTEPILWNFLDNPQGLPHPSHGYWMPLASLVAAFGMWLTGIHNFGAARVGFLILAAFVPLITAKLSFQLSGKKSWALISGLLAIFSGFYLPYMTITDNFTIYLLFGGILFLLLHKITTGTSWVLLCTGIIIGILHLSRSDGILWLLLISLVLAYQQIKNRISIKRIILNLLVVFAGYLLIMAPWFARNLSVFGGLLSPGGMKNLWLTNYNELFSYPSDQLTFQHWWGSGIVEIVKDRFWAAGLNLQRTGVEQGFIFLTPLIILGLWHYRSDIRVQTGFWVWLSVFFLMTMVFPFSGARGGFFHSCAAVQPLFWAVVPAGLGVFSGWGARLRGWNQRQAYQVFSITMIVFAIILTSFVYIKRVVGTDIKALKWQQPYSHYLAIEAIVKEVGESDDDRVMVKNPPGYNIATNRKAIVIPDGDVNTLLSVAAEYGARYVILDKDHPEGLTNLYEDPVNNTIGIKYIESIEGTLIFIIE